METKKKSFWNQSVSGVMLLVIGIVLFALFRGVLGIVVIIIGIILCFSEMRNRKKDKEKKEHLN